MFEKYLRPAMPIKINMELLAWTIILGCCISSSTQSNGKIDKKHLELYPYCGKMFWYNHEATTSRVVNSRESPKQYPWVVHVRRTRRNTMNQDEDKECLGTVIAYKYG